MVVCMCVFLYAVTPLDVVKVRLQAQQAPSYQGNSALNPPHLWLYVV